jgi:hypothetical protein
MADQEGDKQISLSINIDELKPVALKDRKYLERVSCAFIIRMLTVVPGETHEILDEIDYLEGLTTRSLTKPESCFKSPALATLKKKHYFAARHFLRNIGVRWSLDRNGNRDLTAVIKQVADEFGNDPEVWPGKLADRIVAGGFSERIGRLTGDWIIFAKFEDRNYYLDLATHDEALDAEALWRKLSDGCMSEFPFLFGALATASLRTKDQDRSNGIA